MRLMRVGVALLAAGAGCTAAVGQAASSSGAPAPEPQQQAKYTLKMYTRAVLTDVTVTDKKGNPVTGLTEQDFQIFDNGRRQELTSFEEHHEQMAALPAAPAKPGVFSNDFLRNPPPQVNVLLFDTTTVRMLEQMYLFQQMKQFVDALPPGQPVAVFTRNGDVTLQLCGFTDDHAALLAAIQRAIPRFRQPGHWLANDIDTLRQMAIYLSDVPGRKNLIWFTSGSNMILLSGVNQYLMGLPDDVNRSKLYDMLEAERIALYPVNARGLTVSSSNSGPWQRIQMLQDAQATGGEAFINTNGFAQVAQHVVSTDGNYYTLMYSPQDLKNDGKWHQVNVKLNRKGYNLSYRRGYYDDGSNPQELQEQSRAMLKAHEQSAAEGIGRNNPIVFTVQVVPAPAAARAQAGDPPVRRGEQRYEVRFYVPARDVSSTEVQANEGKIVLGAAVLAFNESGSLVSRRMQEVTMSVNETKLRTLPDPRLDFATTVSLPKGRSYLYLAVWDTATERMGTISANVEVGKSGKH